MSPFLRKKTFPPAKHLLQSSKTPMGIEQKFEYDLSYINGGITAFGDVKIILMTVLKVFKREDTVREGTVSDMDFGDWLMLEGKVDESTYSEKQKEAKELLGV